MHTTVRKRYHMHHLKSVSILFDIKSYSLEDKTDIFKRIDSPIGKLLEFAYFVDVCSWKV